MPVELRSNTEWKQWGKDDPLFGVASWANKQRGGSSPWTEAEFYALGESDWQDFLRHWRQYGVETRSCLEIGCGAGRITRPLARTFSRVHAVDVSEDMLRCARKATAACGNVEFSLIHSLRLPFGNGSVPAIFSTHVLQHLDSVELGFSYFREFHRVLSAGGTLMIHLPVYQFPSQGRSGALMRAVYAASRFAGNLRANVKRKLGIKTMRGTHYPLRGLQAFLSELGFQNIEFRIFALTSNGDPHPFVFATK